MRKAKVLLQAIVPAALLVPGVAWAGDQPLYQPPPSWVAPAPALRPADIASGPPLVILDRQTRLEKGVAWAFFDTAVRVDSPEALTQYGTIGGTWSPDKGDLVIHRAILVRGATTIDLLDGHKFTVIQRERGLERRVLDGTLTATLPVTGLRVGDVIRFTYSVTQADSALGGHVQTLSVLPLPTTPARFERVELSWPVGAPVGWKAGPQVPMPAHAERVDHGYKVVSVPLPLPKRDDLPGNAPVRYRRSPILLAGDFAGWTDVSRAMAPLYATQGAIAPGSPLADEVAAIMAQAPGPRERAALALQLVQGRISYLMLGMNNGNYVPQQPAETWALRYGDCKAKSLLLVAMLRAMGIEAEPVLASLQGGDALPELQPLPAAFDHMLVRAVVDGQDLWLDGTDQGARLADLADVPALHYVLPLRAQGADLLPLTWRRPERPFTRLTLRLDESAGIDLPALFDATIELRGAAASRVALAAAQTNDEKREDMARAMIGAVFRGAQVTHTAFASDAVSGLTTITVSGITGTPWVFERGGARHDLDFGQSDITFNADRARPKWQAIPVEIDGPDATALDLALILPDKGVGYRIEGEPAFNGTVAGQVIDRSARIDSGVVRVLDRQDKPAGAEVAASDIVSQKLAASRFASAAPVVRAPDDAVRRWQRDPADRARYAGLEAAFSAGIAQRPDKAEVYANRARFRSGTGDRKGALADFDKAIALEPGATLLSTRADMREENGDMSGALADTRAALVISPADRSLQADLMHRLAKLGRRDEALAVFADALDHAARDRPFVIAALSDALAEAGEAPRALALLDEAATAKPHNAEILNARCWLKGTRQIALDSALADCTEAIELAELPGASLDSRAMIHYRHGETAAALADLDAALGANPGLAGSLFMRGVVRAQTGQAVQARADLASARRLEPAIDRRYADYGIIAPF